MALKKFVPISKIAEQTDGTLFVYGLVTAEQPDLDREVLDYTKSKPFFQKKVEEMAKVTDVPGMEQSIFPMREMHALKAIGAGRTIDFDDVAKTISMGFNVVDPDAVLKFRKGVLTGFSIGGDYYGPKVPDPVFKGCKRYTANPGEVSAVDSPCLPIATVEWMKAKTFDYVKADGSTELRKFHLPLKVEGDEQLMKVNSQEMVACSADESEFELNGAYYKAKPPSQLDTLTEKVQQLSNLIEQGLTKTETLKTGAVTPADPTAAKPAPVTEPLEVPKVNPTGDLDKKDYSDEERKKMADAGTALPDGSFPIATAADLDNAVQAYGRAKDKPKAKSHIQARAKALGAEGKLPDTWDTPKKIAEAWHYLKALKEGDLTSLQKCMADVTDTARILQTLQVITNSQASPWLEEQPDSDLADRLYGSMTDLVEIFKDMVDEETQQLLAATSGGKGEKAMTFEELKKAASAHLAKAIGMVKAHVTHMDAVSKAHHDNVMSLHKAHEGAMEACPNVTAAKAMSKAHMAHMGGVHKAHLDHMASLHKAFGDGMTQHLSKVDSPDAPNILSAAQAGGEPGAIDLTSQGTPSMDPPGHDNLKALTAEDLKKALDEQKTTLEKSFEAKQDETLELLAKALIALQADGVQTNAVTGIGDRAHVVQKTNTPKVTQPPIVVTKVGDLANTDGTGGRQVVVGEVITQEDVVKGCGQGDQDALLKLARSIRTNPTGVPAHLAGTKLMARQ